MLDGDDDDDDDDGGGGGGGGGDEGHQMKAVFFFFDGLETAGRRCNDNHPREYDKYMESDHPQ